MTKSSNSEQVMHVLGDKIAIEVPEKKERKTRSGILLADTVDVLDMEGTVIAIGKGKWNQDKKTKQWSRTEFQVKVGDRVVFAPGTAIEMTAGDQKVHLIEERNIIGIIV